MLRLDHLSLHRQGHRYLHLQVLSLEQFELQGVAVLVLQGVVVLSLEQFELQGVAVLGLDHLRLNRHL